MALEFPTSPADQDEYTFEGRTWIYLDPPGVWRLSTTEFAVARSLEIVEGAAQLVNDEDTPEVTNYYGTDALGVRGYHPFSFGELSLPLEKAYFGCNVGSYDNQWLYVNPGTFADSTGADWHSFSDVCWVDVTSEGINEAGTPPDTGSAIVGGWAEGSSPSSPSPVNLYAVTRDSDGAVAFLATSYDTYGGVSPFVPVGWTLQRKMHWSTIYVLGRHTYWNGLPVFFQDIDNSRTILQGAGDDAGFRVLNAGASTTFSSVSMANYCADAARYCEVMCILTATSGSQGFARIAVPGVGSKLMYVPGSSSHAQTVWTKLDSSRNFQYLVSGCTLTVYGPYSYTFDEPT